jgi:hypothetical protein
LRFAATLEDQFEPNRIMSAEKAIEFFREECQPHQKIVKVTNCFLEISEVLKQLHDNPRLEAVTDISHARLLAVSILLKSSLTTNERQ